MPPGYSLKSYTYWGVTDISACVSFAGEIVDTPMLPSPFFHLTVPLFAIAVLVSPFLLSQLVNLFPKNVGYAVTIITSIYPPSECSFLWFIWRKRNCFMSIIELFPLCSWCPYPIWNLLGGNYPLPIHILESLQIKGMCNILFLKIWNKPLQIKYWTFHLHKSLNHLHL